MRVITHSPDTSARKSISRSTSPANFTSLAAGTSKRSCYLASLIQQLSFRALFTEEYLSALVHKKLDDRAKERLGTFAGSKNRAAFHARYADPNVVSVTVVSKDADYAIGQRAANKYAVLPVLDWLDTHEPESK
ncbi:hypothetical protein ACFQH5_01805 [Halomonas salifodinae]|uniref:Uncharacterized protein n=1 Tax=Halomonas salifodinae TaxID=438745 RepID=A0ABW2EQZ5_9GAMM